jgi:hypothetical protein
MRVSSTAVLETRIALLATTEVQSAADQSTQADVAGPKERRPLFQGMAACSFDHLLQVIVYQE